jgi:hypothetical protein
MDDPQNLLQAALDTLVGDGEESLDALTEAFEAYLRARSAGQESDLRSSLPAAPNVVTVTLEITGSAIWRSLGGDWHDQSFRDACWQRSGLQALVDATGLAPDLTSADAGLRRWGDEGYLTPDQIPDVPPSHWWWWLPHDPPRDVS